MLLQAMVVTIVEPKEDKELRTAVWLALLILISVFLIGAVVLANFL